MADVTDANNEPSNATANASDPPNDNEGGEASPVAEKEAATAKDATDMAEGKEPPDEEKDEAAKDADGDVAMADGKEDGAEVQKPLNGTPSSKKPQKRKSSSGVPEHKSKKLNRKKSVKDMQLHLEVEPGQYWFARMKGYPPWPCIICDEEMLPETLLKTRPVSAKRLDGSYREDFNEGGKNARDRTYPVMFLGTNEFAWQVNTMLEPLDIEKVKEETPDKKTKAYWEAHKVAMEEHVLQYFKDMLAEHESAIKQDRKEKAEKEAKKNAKKDPNRRKSKDKAAEEDDYDMDDVEDEEGELKSKGGKKRKKDVESEGEAIKPAKTPKTKIKVNGPRPLDEESASKKKDKSSKSKSSGKKSKGEEGSAKTQPKEKPLTETEIRNKRQVQILFLRHKLQKGFLFRDQAPIEEEMTTMSDYLTQLENYANLEAPIIRATKINKVLKGIVKLNYIPREEEFNFKKRSTELLTVWNKALNADGGASAGAGSGAAAGEQPAAEEGEGAAVNGVTKAHEDGEAEEKKDEEEGDKMEADGDGKEEGEEGDKMVTNGDEEEEKKDEDEEVDEKMEATNGEKETDVADRKAADDVKIDAEMADKPADEETEEKAVGEKAETGEGEEEVKATAEDGADKNATEVSKETA